MPDIIHGNCEPCGLFLITFTGYLMHRRHQKTYADLHAEPIKRNIHWDDVVSLIEALGGQVIHNEGSRRRFDLNGISLNIHSPHPQKEIKRYQVKAIREFLQLAGVKP